MATKKATKKKATKKKAPAAGAIVMEELSIPQKHRVQLHNTTNQVVNWTLSGGGSKEKGVMPGMASAVVRVNHAKSYKVTMWSDPAKKLSERCPPHGEAIYTGRKIACTIPI